jgi:hypothetical protein
VTLQDYKNNLEEYQKKPERFVREVLNGDPEEWQVRVLEDAAKMDKPIAIQSGAGVGKTTLLVWLILWFLCCFPYSQIPCTAPSKHHLIDLLWAQLHQWIRKSHILAENLVYQQTKLSMKGFEPEWFAVARTGQVTPDGKVSEGLQGFHADFMLFILDETSGIADQVIAATDGIMATGRSLIVMASNPIRTSGAFYDACTKPELKGVYYRHKISCLDVPHINPGYNTLMLAKYGPNDPIYLSKVLGEFPTRAGNVLFDPTDVNAIYRKSKFSNKELEAMYGPLKIAVDIADGGDCDSVATLRRGPCIQAQIAFRAEDTEGTADEIERIIIAYSPSRVFVDAVGVGSGVYATLRRRKYLMVRPARGSDPALDPELYLNTRCELYFLGARLVRDREVFAIFDCDRLKADLLRHKQVTSTGIFAVTPKEILRKTGKSPDYSDSWIMTYTDERDKKRKETKSNAGIIAANQALAQVGRSRSSDGFPAAMGHRLSSTSERFGGWEH